MNAGVTAPRPSLLVYPMSNFEGGRDIDVKLAWCSPFAWSFLGTTPPEGIFLGGGGRMQAVCAFQGPEGTNHFMP